MELELHYTVIKGLCPKITEVKRNQLSNSLGMREFSWILKNPKNIVSSFFLILNKPIKI